MGKLKKDIMLFVQYLVLILVAFVSIFPFIWMVICATNTSTDVVRHKMTFGTNTLVNLQNLLQPEKGFLRALVNTTVVAVVTTLLALIVCSLAGYAFVVYRSKKRDTVFHMLLLTMMIPFSSIMVPLYRMFAAMRNIPALSLVGMNTLGAMILPYISTAFLIFFFRQNTMSFPIALIEAARIDGMSELKIFCRIFVPIMKSTYAAGAIVTFMNSWNNYLWPLLVAQSDDTRMLQMVLSALGQSYTTDYGTLMIGVLIATVPSAIIYFVMQKEFVAGMAGSLK